MLPLFPAIPAPPSRPPYICPQAPAPTHFTVHLSPGSLYVTGLSLLPPDPQSPVLPLTSDGLSDLYHPSQTQEMLFGTLLKWFRVFSTE